MFTYEDLLDGGFTDEELDDMLINRDLEALGAELDCAMCNVLNKEEEYDEDC